MIAPRRLLTDFQAEAKRSWFSLGDSLRGARSKGVLWLPARVSLHDSTLTIATSETTREFSPHRLVWQGPNQFSVSGLDHAGHLSRVVLRFTAGEDARTAAAGLLETGMVIEEPLPPRSFDIEAEMTPQIPLSSTFWIIILMTSVAVLFFGWNSNLADFAGWGFLVLILLAPFVYLPTILNKNQQAWIRQEGTALLLQTDEESFPLADVRLEWKGSRTFSFETGKRRLKLSFKTREDALAVIQLLKSEIRNGN